MHDTRKRIIAPSVLAADWSRLGEDCERAIRSGADWLHLDIMDGHFVENISFGPKFVRTIHETTDIFLDVHLMISKPDDYLQQFVAAGADNITVHVESEHDVPTTLTRIKESGVAAGLALNPDTPLSQAEAFLDSIDLLLVMTVHPGFGGQSFIFQTMEKVLAADSIRRSKGLDFRIEVDGGIDSETARMATENGADVLVAGTALFKAPDMSAAINQMRSA